MLSQKIKTILSKDPKMATLIEKIPHSQLQKLKSSKFQLREYLILSIIGQQLAIKAADAIKKKFIAQFENQIPSSERILATPDEILKSCGLSTQKLNYIKNISQYWIDNKLDKKDLVSLSDEELIELLTPIKGVGKWTVQMVLMFCLARPDVFAPEDYGLQSAMVELYRLKQTGAELKKKTVLIAEKWKPYRTTACLYLWAFKDQNGSKNSKTKKYD
ncbi:MAG TPA: DNA-3-methyladenine glycosylase 2 family protein [Saprospiraceae bacterium]|nr:DNA-3-methyladenine glycosylase 2 family protein [Saprospiraceae bacterium]